MKLPYVFNDFRLGEVSPYIEGAVNLEKYTASCRQLQNWTVRKEFGLERRTGSSFVSKTYSSANSADYKCRLIAFNGSDADYVLEFCAAASGRSAIRVYGSTGTLYDSSWAAVSNTWTGTGYTFRMPATTSRFGSPDYFFTSTELSEAFFYQRGNKLYVTHRNHAPVIITYTPSAAGVKFDSAYAELFGNPYLDDDLDDLGRNILGSTPTKSFLEFDTDGYFGTSTTDIQTVSVEAGDTVDNICSIILAHSSGDEYKYVARPEWVGATVIFRASNSVFGTTDGAAKITQYCSENELLGVVLDPVGGGSYTGYATFSAPVLGSTVRIDINNSLSPVDANDIGLSYMADGGSFRVTAVSSTTRATCEVIRQVLNAACGANNVTGNVLLKPNQFRTWARPAWGNNTTSEYTSAVQTGWPGCGVWFQGRHILAGSKAEPQNIWGSRTGTEFNFAPGPDDDEAFQFRLGFDKNSDIRVVFSGSVLFVGTQNGIYRATARDQILTPSNFALKAEVSYGVERVQPVSLGAFSACIQRGAKIIRAVRYNDSLGALESFDLTRMSGHITGDGATQLAAGSNEQSNIYALRSDGQIAVAGIENEIEAPAWSRYRLLDRSASTDAIAVVESVASLSTDTGVNLWVQVKRTIGGATTRTIERLVASRWLDLSFNWDQFAAVGGTVTGTTDGLRVQNLAPLMGQKVHLMLAGAVYGEYTVATSGSITQGFDVPLTYRNTTVTSSATTGAVTVTFNGSDASSSLVDSVIILRGGGAIKLTGYTNVTTMSGTVVTTITTASTQPWFPLTNFLVGIKYESVYESHKPEPKLKDGTAQTRMKRIVDGFARLYDTQQLKVRYGSTDQELAIRTTTGAGDTGPTAYTGDFEFRVPSTFDRAGTVTFVADSGYNANILMVKANLDVSDN